MKKLATLICAATFALLPCFASESAQPAESMAPAMSTSSSRGVVVPKGAFFNGNNFVYVQDGWVRIVINGSRNEYNYTAQMDPNNNYVLRLENGEAITIYPNGRSLYYNGVKYDKR